MVTMIQLVESLRTSYQHKKKCLQLETNKKVIKICLLHKDNFLISMFLIKTILNSNFYYMMRQVHS